MFVAIIGILSGELATCLSAPESSEDIYDIALTSNRANYQDYPAVRLEIEQQFAIKLAVSLHSNDTWLLRSSPNVCPGLEACPVLDLGKEVLDSWNYTGQDGLKLWGSKYNFSSITPTLPKGTQWNLDNFTIGVSTKVEGIEGLGDYVDGVLGLGPASTFIRQLTGTSEHKFSLFLGRDNGTFVIDGFYKNQAWGKYARRGTGIGGILPLHVQRFSLGSNDRTLLQNTNAIIDPTSPDIVIPRSRLLPLIGEPNMDLTLTSDDKIKFGQDMQEQGRWPSLVFDIGNDVTIVVREDAYTSDSQPALSIGDGDQIILGRPFLHSAYLILDHFHTTYYVAQANAILPDADLPSHMRDFNEEGQVEYQSPENQNPKNQNSENQNSEPTTTEGEDVPDSESHKPSSNMKTGAIVGGTLGGIALLASLFGIFFLCRRRSSHLPRAYMGPHKRLSDLSLYSTQSEVMPPPYSPPSHIEEDIYLMGGYAYVGHQLEPSMGSTIYAPHNTPYNTGDTSGSFQVPSSSRSFHRNQDLVRSESNATTIADLDVHENRDSQNCPRLPMYNTCTSQGPAL